MKYFGQFMTMIGIGALAKFSGYVLTFEAILAIAALVVGIPILLEGIIISAIKTALKKEADKA